jgi:hypothetical protein
MRGLNDSLLNYRKKLGKSLCMKELSRGLFRTNNISGRVDAKTAGIKS